MGSLVDPTPSTFARLALCIRSGDAEGAAEEVTPWAGDGSSRHERTTKALAGEDVDCEDLDVEGIRAKLQGGQFSADVGLLWSPWTGEAYILGVGFTREQAHALARERVKALEGRWIVGVADLLGIVVTPNGERVVIVPDLKFGHERPAEPENDWQTKAYGVAAAQALGATRILHGCLWAPGGQRPGWVGGRPGEMGAQAMLEFEGAVCKLLDEAERVAALPEAERPAPRYGEHCAYCRQAYQCAARTEQLARFSALDRVEGKLVITAENAARVHQRVQAVEKMLKDAKSALKDFASTNPFPLPNGEVFGPHMETEREVSAARLPAALNALVLDHIQGEVLRECLTVGLEKLEKIVVKALNLGPRKGAEAKRRLEVALKETGALTTTEVERIGAHRTKREG